MGVGAWRPIYKTTFRDFKVYATKIPHKMEDPIEDTVSDLTDEDHGSPISKAIEEHGDVDPEVLIESAQKQVEAREVGQDVVDTMFTPPGVDEQVEATRSEDHAYMRNVTFVPGQEEVEVDPNNDLEKAEDAKQHAKEVEAINQELKAYGSHQRYVVSKSDAPDGAYVYEDEFGKYYYKGPDQDFRPSHVAEFAEKEAWTLLGEDEQVVKTIELLNEITGEPLADADSAEKAEAWLRRCLTHPEKAQKADDVFDPDFIERTAKMIAAASVRKEDDKGNSNEDGST